MAGAKVAVQQIHLDGNNVLLSDLPCAIESTRP